MTRNRLGDKEIGRMGLKMQATTKKVDPHILAGANSLHENRDCSRQDRELQQSSAPSERGPEQGQKQCGNGDPFHVFVSTGTSILWLVLAAETEGGLCRPQSRE
jgi:hypothetical protein